MIDCKVKGYWYLGGIMSIETFENLPMEKKELIIKVGIQEFSNKSYKDVSTDEITRKCQISKGLLFHYFGSKKEYYLYCLDQAMACLTENTSEYDGDDFYDIIFASMNSKLMLCTKYQAEMHMVNMASRDASKEIAIQKSELLGRYMVKVQSESMKILNRAIDKIEFKNNENKARFVEGMHIYINAVLNKYLVMYQKTPDDFFINSENIKIEIKEYLDLMLYGVCK